MATAAIITTERHRRLAGIGIVVFAAAAALPLGRWLAPGDSLAAHLLREGIWWLIGAAVVGWVTRVERRPLASIGLRRLGGGSLGWGIVAAGAMIASFMLSYAVIFPAFHLAVNRTAVASITHVPLWLQTATMVRAGVVEELVFRGYLIERLTLLTGRRGVAAVVSAFAFIAVHLGTWGYAQLIVVAFGALILTALYLWRRDLAANMVAHFLADFVGFMLARLQGA